MTNQEHLPDPEFVSRLEHQLAREFQRRERLGLNDRPQPESRREVRALGFTCVGLLLGAGCVTTAQHIEDASRTELLLRQAEANASIAEQRATVYREQAESDEQRWEQGTLSFREIYPTQSEVIDAELQHALADLDVAAINAGGGPVRDEISAPRVKGLDLFSERLQLELDANARHVALLEPRIEFEEARVQAGVTLPSSLEPLTMEMAQLAALATQIRETLSLRESFLNGDMDAGEAELRYRLILATGRRQFAEAQLDSLRAADERIQQRVAVGVAPSSDAVVSENDIQRAEVEAQIARMEVELIAAQLGQ
jgi:hypothetical protein